MRFDLLISERSLVVKTVQELAIATKTEVSASPIWISVGADATAKSVLALTLLVFILIRT